MRDYCSFFGRKMPILLLWLLYAAAFMIMSLITSKYFSFEQFMHMQFSVENSLKFYEKFDFAGFKHSYFYGLIWDYPYMLTYTAALIYTMGYVMCKNRLAKANYLFILPFVGFLSDASENVLEFLIIKRFPTYSLRLVQLRVILSTMKWLFIGFSAVVIIFLAIRYLVRSKRIL